MKIGDIVTNGCVEIQLAAFNELHDRDVGKQFRYGPNAIYGRCGGGLLARRIRDPKSLSPHGLLIVNQSDRKSRYLFFGELPLYKRSNRVSDRSIVLANGGISTVCGAN